MTEIFIILGVLVASFALRTFRVRFLSKLGALGILAASFLAGYLPTKMIWVGLLSMSFWFLLPWVELLTRIRHLRLPLSKVLRKQAPPGSSKFPSLNDFTEEIEEAGFEYVADTGWDWEEMNQFYRIFYHGGKRMQAAICFTEQEHVSWASVSLTTRHQDGRSFRTTNLPFSNPMKSSPSVLMQRKPEIESFERLMDLHDSWTDGLGCDFSDLVEENPEQIPRQIEEEAGNQIQFNLESGIISPGENGDTFRYSWRGLFYIYFQLVKDMVRLS